METFALIWCPIIGLLLSFYWLYPHKNSTYNKETSIYDNKRDDI